MRLKKREMSNLYKNKYRVNSTRLQNFDYSSSGYYFVTICTLKKTVNFGTITNSKNIKFSSVGNIADKFWKEIPLQYPQVKLDEYIVMPNHVHGILSWQQTLVVETDNYLSLPKGNHFGRQSKNIPSVIRAYKASVKRWANENKVTFAWQSRYFYHIVRNGRHLDAIRIYIQDNPRKWAEDEYYAEQLSQ